MLEALYHRGPDEGNKYSDESLSLGIRRLSIIDLKTGSQPIFNEDKSMAVVCNGELYNFRRLKDALVGKGHNFYTGSDVEILVHLYEEYGTDCLRNVKGMFSFALWDKNKKVLFLARDRFGIKPLYYYHRNGIFAFASEPKALLRLPFISRQMNLKALDLYFSLEYIPSPHSIIEDIYKLEPGHYILLKGNDLMKRRYWDLRSGPGVRGKLSAATIKESLREKINTSVSEHLISDVPLGIFLSGGIDSSTIVALTKELYNKDFSTFSIGFEEKSFDESEYASAVSRYFGTRHHSHIFTFGDFVKDFCDVVKFLDEPLADFSIFPTYMLSKFSSRYVKVALSGEGADELFMGYPTYSAHKYAGLLRILPKGLKKAIGALVDSFPVSFNYLSLDFRLKQFMKADGESDPLLRNIIWMGSFCEEEKEQLFKNYGSFPSGGECALKDFLGNLKDKGCADNYKLLQYADIFTYLSEDLLVKADRAGMASSLEIRVPYLDHELVEFAWGLNHSLLYRKKLLKDIMRGKIPRRVLSRFKKGFAMPLASWIGRDKFFAIIREFFEREFLIKQGLFNCDYVIRMLKEHLSGKKDNRKKLGTYIIFQSWYRHWLN